MFVLLDAVTALGDGPLLDKSFSHEGLKPLGLIYILSTLRTVCGIAVSLLGFAYPIRLRFIRGF